MIFLSFSFSLHHNARPGAVFSLLHHDFTTQQAIARKKGYTRVCDEMTMKDKKKEKAPKRYEIDMLEGPLAGKILAFALPLAATSVLQQMFNMADTAIVGRFAGPEAMAAVGSNTPLINLIISLFVGMATGANVVIARLIGRREYDRIGSAVHTIITLAIISGVFLQILGFILSKPLLEMVGVPEDILPLAMLYFRILFLGAPLMLLYNFGAAILRSRGDSKRPLYALTFSGVINVLLNMLLVIVFHLSVAGVAIATVVSNLVTTVIILIILAKEEAPYTLSLRKLRVDTGILKDVLFIGIPAGLQGMVFSIANTTIQSAINGLGSVYMAGNAASVSFDGLSYYVMNAFSQAAATFVSQNYGGRKPDRCKKVFWITMGMAVLSSTVLNILFVVFGHPLLSLFTVSEEVIRIGMIRMTHVLIFQTLVCTYELGAANMRGLGYSLTPTLLIVFGTCILRILWVLYVFPQYGTYEMLVIVFPISWVVTGAMVLGAYFIVRRKAFAKIAA